MFAPPPVPSDEDAMLWSRAGIVVGCCAKRSFRPWVPEKLLSVSSFVRSRKIIDFCEGDMEGVTPLLSTGSLNV